MLPLRLELKNFLPYRSPDPIRFDGIHLACLTGPNGAGKSSILDAMTWALWGNARAKRDEDLIHLGQQDMMVQLDFEQEGVIYRVVRKRTRSKRASGSLDLFVLREDGHPTLINEPSMRDTEHKINTLLRLDYETFIHSAFLQQGRADAFTVKNPAERKRILSDILGLEQWAVYEERVKEILKRIETELNTLELRLHEIDTELAKEPQYIASMDSAQKAHAEAQVALDAAQTRLDEVAHAPAELKRAREQLAMQQQRIKEHERDLHSIATEIMRQQENIARYEAVVTERDTIETGYATLQQAREADVALGEKLRQMSDYDKQYRELERILDAARAELEKERSSYMARIAELERELNGSNNGELHEVQAQIAELEEAEGHRDAIQLAAQAASEERSGLLATQKALEAEGKNIGDRIAQLESSDLAVCPLCGQPLDAEHKAELMTQLTSERDERRKIYTDNRTRIKTLDADSLTYKAQTEELAIELKRLSPLREKAGALQIKRDRAQEAERRLMVEEAQLAAVSDMLEKDLYGQDIREQLATLTQERDALGYDRQTHDATRETLEHYREYEKRHTQLQVAQEALPAAQEALANATTRQTRVGKAIEEERTNMEKLDGEIAQLEVLVHEEQIRREEVNRQRTAANSAYERLVTAQQQLKALEGQRKRKTEILQRQEARRHDEALYKELRLAFSKNGVPAMIIETAIPELEAEANDLLSRMTDGRMSLRLTTQREKVTGGVAETLEIEISDELGTRAYEMYSGGEAFRINFAIRIALSKMLARRAGAHLRTLFIDEGFGSQDEDGRGKLVEAIIAIQHDFDLILVITHIDELRDSFPVHVLVDKTGNGSMVSVR